MSRSGKFVWHDLMTTDMAKAKPFYRDLLGWEIRESGPYQLILNEGKDLGAFMDMPKEHGAPSHWLGYVVVDDVAAAGMRAVRCGGRVAVPPHDIPNVGKFSVLVDPQGTPISAFSYNQEPDKAEDYGVGRFVWNELLTTDINAALGFYGEVFGWTTETMDMGGMGKYTMLKRGDQTVAGAMAMPPGQSHPAHWLHYIHVADVDKAYARAVELGATAVMPLMTMPGVGRFGNLRDPSGAIFALFNEFGQKQ